MNVSKDFVRILFEKSVDYQLNLRSSIIQRIPCSGAIDAISSEIVVPHAVRDRVHWNWISDANYPLIYSATANRCSRAKSGGPDV